LRDAGRVVEAAIANARATEDMHTAGDTLPGLVWAHRPPDHPAPRSWAEVAPSTPESTALARELKRRGLRFVGPTTVYAMHLLGLRMPPMALPSTHGEAISVDRVPVGGL
jgi:3-methyladenine DNA glycosylase Tag